MLPSGPRPGKVLQNQVGFDPCHSQLFGKLALTRVNGPAIQFVPLKFDLKGSLGWSKAPQAVVGSIWMFGIHLCGADDRKGGHNMEYIVQFEDVTDKCFCDQLVTQLQQNIKLELK